jgi:hypothetical protein
MREWRPLTDTFSVYLADGFAAKNHKTRKKIGCVIFCVFLRLFAANPSE